MMKKSELRKIIIEEIRLAEKDDALFDLATKVYDIVDYDQLGNKNKIRSALKKLGYGTDPLTVGQVMRKIKSEIGESKLSEGSLDKFYGATVKFKKPVELRGVGAYVVKSPSEVTIMESKLNEGADWIYLPSGNGMFGIENMSINSYDGFFLDARDMYAPEYNIGTKEWKKIFAKLNPKDKRTVKGVLDDLKAGAEMAKRMRGEVKKSKYLVTKSQYEIEPDPSKKRKQKVDRPARTEGEENGAK